jgi:ketosteroid isomerase-like protein
MTAPQDVDADEQRRQRNVAAVLRAFEAVNRGDAEAQLAEYAEDAVMEFPFPVRTAPNLIEGRDAIGALLRDAFTRIELHLSVTEILACADPDRLVVEFTSTGRLLDGSGDYANRYINVFAFADGRIRLHREYLDPGPLAGHEPQGLR